MPAEILPHVRACALVKPDRDDACIGNRAALVPTQNANSNPASRSARELHNIMLHSICVNFNSSQHREAELLLQRTPH